MKQIRYEVPEPHLSFVLFFSFSIEVNNFILSSAIDKMHVSMYIASLFMMSCNGCSERSEKT
jgi:hypothetical protein